MNETVQKRIEIVESETRVKKGEQKGKTGKLSETGTNGKKEKRKKMQPAEF